MVDNQDWGGVYLSLPSLLAGPLGRTDLTKTGTVMELPSGALSCQL